MNKLFKRFVAYTIDMMVVLLIVECLSGIPLINRNLDKYNKYYNEYLNIYIEYNNFKTNLEEVYEDNILSLNEYNKLIEDNDSYTKTLNKYYVDGELTKDNYSKLVDLIDNEYKDTYKDYYYKIEKNSVINFIIYLVVVFAYYVLFNIVTNGQTLGKKLMRLRIVNAKCDEDKVRVWSYIVRTLVLYQPLYYLARLIGVSILDVDMYYNFSNIIYNIQGFLEMSILGMMMISINGRGLQDFVSMTRVALYDRSGNEIKPEISIFKQFNINNENDSEDKEIIDEKSTE